MAELDDALDALRNHPGVEHALLLGRDGLLIQHSGEGALDAETFAAMVPGVASAAANLAAAADAGTASDVVARLQGRVAIVSVLSGDVLLALLLREGVGFAPLLGELEQRRDALAALV